jgi:ATP/maltotriose-dependent transcriptional regulator MalT
MNYARHLRTLESESEAADYIEYLLQRAQREAHLVPEPANTVTPAPAGYEPTPTERRIIYLVCMDYKNHEIAGELHMNTDALEKALYRLNTKLEVKGGRKALRQLAKEKNWHLEP